MFDYLEGGSVLRNVSVKIEAGESVDSLDPVEASPVL